MTGVSGTGCCSLIERPSTSHIALFSVRASDFHWEYGRVIHEYDTRISMILSHDALRIIDREVALLTSICSKHGLSSAYKRVDYLLDNEVLVVNASCMERLLELDEDVDFGYYVYLKDYRLPIDESVAESVLWHGERLPVGGIQIFVSVLPSHLDRGHLFFDSSLYPSDFVAWLEVFEKGLTRAHTIHLPIKYQERGGEPWSKHAVLTGR